MSAIYANIQIVGEHMQALNGEALIGDEVIRVDLSLFKIRRGRNQTESLQVNPYFESSGGFHLVHNRDRDLAQLELQVPQMQGES